MSSSINEEKLKALDMPQGDRQNETGIDNG